VTFRQFAYRNVIRNSRIYAAFFMASFFSVMVFFIYSMLMFHPSIETGVISNVSLRGMVIAEVTLVLFSLFFLYYSMNAFLEARSKEFGILLHLGMEKRQLNGLVFLETMLIGFGSIFVGILFGYSFSKFFFMIVREILNLDSLPLYLSWKPFVLTTGVFTSAFVVISFISVYFMRDRKVLDLMNSYEAVELKSSYSLLRAIYGLVLIGVAYILALLLSKIMFFSLASFIPILAAFGTYYFFTDTMLFFVDVIRRSKKRYWKRYRLLSLAEQTHIIQTNAKMYFIVTMVTTLAFLSIGLLATMSSYTSQYDKLNPLGLVYKGAVNNPYETEHINSLLQQLQEKGLSYHLTHFVVKRQTSSYTQNEVEIFRESDVNSLLSSFGYPFVNVDSGKAIFIPHSEESLKNLKNKVVRTVLLENSLPLVIDSVYPKIVFPSSIVSVNSIIISDEDYEKLRLPLAGDLNRNSSYHLYTFDVAQWMETKDIKIGVEELIAEESLNSWEYNLPFYYENAGLNYSYILATYSLFTLVGLLVAAVFLLAAGSFVYFKLHTGLEREKRKFDALRRMGLTDSELKRLVSRYLLPQFFLPWGIALLHSTFAFLALQAVLRDIVDLSIVKEVLIAYCIFVMIQVIYYLLIRWRYLSHVKG